MRVALDAAPARGRRSRPPTRSGARDDRRPETHVRRRRRRRSADGRLEPPPPTPLLARLREGRFVVSVEIDPPRSIRIDRTIEAAALLRDAGVDLVNISDSAMARVRMGAMAVAFGIQHDLDLECLVHFTTRDRNLMAIESELLGAHALGVRNILALTGDPPRIGDYPTGTGVWDVDSIGLVEILARLNRGEDQAGSPIGQPAGFTIACALDPTAADAATEWDRLERKLAAGAHLVMTQPLYSTGQVEAMLGRGPAAVRRRRLPGPGAARRPAAPERPPRRVPPQRGARHHDPRRRRGPRCATPATAAPRSGSSRAWRSSRRSATRSPGPTSCRASAATSSAPSSSGGSGRPPARGGDGRCAAATPRRAASRADRRLARRDRSPRRVALAEAAADPPPDRVEGQQVYDDGAARRPALVPRPRRSIVDLIADAPRRRRDRRRPQPRRRPSTTRTPRRRRPPTRSATRGA